MHYKVSGGNVRPHANYKMVDVPHLIKGGGERWLVFIATGNRKRQWKSLKLDHTGANLTPGL